MNCCRRCVTAAQFDDKVARKDLLRFRHRGPDKPTRQILAAVQSRHLPPDPTLLDIGGGIGAIHHLLLDQGFTTATHIDASDAYLELAAEEAKQRGHADRVRFVLAEFPAEGSPVTPADVVTLNRVVCCFPDYAGLLGAAASHSRRALVFSYPRPRWPFHLYVAINNAYRRLRRLEFRSFVHPPRLMKAVLEEAGMRQAWEGGTWVWAVELYTR
jgi:magnesium-protoporphyrin O-methyltransferase